MRKLLAFLSFLPAFLPAAEIIEKDICVYGGTAGGVAAAVEAARMGKSVVLLEPGSHIGGLTSGGLGATDIGNKAAIGGISREFYHRVALHYANDESWTLEKREDYFKNRSAPPAATDLRAGDATMWTFEPHVAQDILFQMLNDAKAPVLLQHRLGSVKKDGTRIAEIITENGKVFRAKEFIDASYEGDLMAKAGVSYSLGREANSDYGETLDGVRQQTPKHQFTVNVDPYLKAGDAASGLLPLIQNVEPGPPGAGDASIQAYNFRLCYTRNPANRLPHRPPPNYNPARYELLARYLEALVAAGKKPVLEQFWNPIWMPNGKTDINNNGGFSTDFIGANYDYPNASYARRAEIVRAHQDYTLGFIYFLATSARVPENMRAEMKRWGPAKDEFADAGNWPNQLYVREARRMISAYVMTEQNCRGQLTAEDPVGLAAYTMDSHNCRRIVRAGHVENEGDVQVGGFPPYSISYRAIIPKAAECENLLVPICLSATHIAYGSIRMEPVFMILGQSAATAAALAIDANTPVQQLEYSKLHHQLLADNQVLQWKAKPAAKRTEQVGSATNKLHEPKRVVIPRLASSIQIDGELDDLVWNKAARLEPFFHNEDGTPEREHTEVRLWYDSDALYLGWTCNDIDIQATLTDRDSKFWEEEVVEFFLTAKALDHYFELQWSPLGGVFDATIENDLDATGISRAFHGDWSFTAGGMKHAVKLKGTPNKSDDKDEFWQVEVRLPFSDLNQPCPKPGEVWRGNFYRFNRTKDLPPEELSWSPTRLPGFHQPSRFGYLEFGQ